MLRCKIGARCIGRRGLPGSSSLRGQSRSLSLGGWFGGPGSTPKAVGDAAASASVNAEVASFSVEPAAAAAASSQSFAQSIESPGRRSLVERMDDGWTDFFSGLGLPHFGFIDGGSTWLQVLEATAGIGWPGTLFVFGFAVRLVTLGLSIYGERATLRMALATREVRQEHEAYDAVYSNHASTQVEIRRAAETMKSARDASFAKHGTSMMAVMTPILGAPVFCGGFAVVLRTLNDAPRSLVAAGGIGPASSLMMPDPSGLFAVGAIAATLINFELTLARKRSGATNTTGAMSFVPWLARAMAVGVVPVVMQFKTGTVIYWCGLSFAGLLQPLIMSSPAFRRWFNVPDVGPEVQPNPFVMDADPAPRDSPAGRAAEGSSAMALQFPRLTKFFTPGAMLEAVDQWEASKDATRLHNPAPSAGGPARWRKPAMDRRGQLLSDKKPPQDPQPPAP